MIEVLLNGAPYSDAAAVLVINTVAPPPPAPPPAVGLIPKLTANSQNGYLAYSSSVYDEAGTYSQPYFAFDDTDGSNWQTNMFSTKYQATPSAPQHLGIITPAPIESTMCQITARLDSTGFRPINGSLVARNGSGSFVTLQTYTGLSFVNGKAQLTYPSQGAFSDHRFVCTDSDALFQTPRLQFFYV
jgi:hypothetical protein